MILKMYVLVVLILMCFIVYVIKIVLICCLSKGYTLNGVMLLICELIAKLNSIFL